MNLTTADSRAGQSESHFFQDWTSSDKPQVLAVPLGRHAGSSETSPADSSPLGVEIIAGSGTATASNSTAQAGTEWVVTMAMHRASETGSRPTQLIGPCMLPAQQRPVVDAIQNCHTGVSPAQDMKSLSFNMACQYQMEIWRCPLFPCPWW